MELTTILGIPIALVGLLVGMILKGVGLDALANPAAILIILVGTTGAVMNATPGKELGKIGSLFKLALMGRKQENNEEIIKQFMGYSQTARKEGLLALEGTIETIEDPFTKRAMSLLMTGQDVEFLRSVLETEIETIDERHKGLATIFSQAGSYAPTLGVLGAVVGLIAAMGNMDDTELLAHAIAGAFMATIYGIFTGYVLWNPFANKLKRLNAYEMHSKHIIAEGVLLLVQGFAPNLVEEYLVAYLTPKEKADYLAANGGGSNG